MVLALSPRHALMIVRDRNALSLADDPMRFANSMRVRIARHALRHVYARDNDSRVCELVQATRTPDIVFKVGDELIPGAVDARELIRRLARSGGTTIGVRYTDGATM
jgi:hypothetical protein